MSNAEEIRAKLTRVTSASLADAVQKLYGHASHVLDLVTPTPGRVLWGEAVTMQFVPLRADVENAAHDFAPNLERALGAQPRGKVVVMACAGAPDAAVAGGVRLAMLERHACAGLLTDARLRDFHEVRAYSFAAYCRGATPRAGSLDAMVGAVNVPVAIGGATVLPGDHVYADEAGAIVIPRGDAVRVIDAALEVEARDAERVKKALGH